MTRRRDELAVDTSSPISNDNDDIDNEDWSPIPSDATTLFRSGLVHRHARHSHAHNDDYDDDLLSYAAQRSRYAAPTPSKQPHNNNNNNKRKSKQSVSLLLWLAIVFLYAGSAYLWYCSMNRSHNGSSNSINGGLPPLPEYSTWRLDWTTNEQFQKQRNKQTNTIDKQRQARVQIPTSIDWDQVTIAERTIAFGSNDYDMVNSHGLAGVNNKCGTWLASSVTAPLQRVLFTVGVTTALDAALMKQLLQCNVQIKVVLTNPSHFSQEERLDHWSYLDSILAVSTSEIQIYPHDTNLGDLVQSWQPTHVVHSTVPFVSSFSNTFQLYQSILSIQSMWQSIATTNKRPHLYISSLQSNKVARMIDIMATALQKQYAVSSVTVWHLADLILGPGSNIDGMVKEDSDFKVNNDVSWIASTDALEIVIANLQRPAEHAVHIADQYSLNQRQLKTLWAEHQDESTNHKSMTIDWRQTKSIASHSLNYDWLVASRTPINDAWMQTMDWTNMQNHPWTVQTDQALPPTPNVFAPFDESDLPCASGCTTHQNCPVSMWDNVIEMSVETTEGCDVVLYTQQMSLHARDLDLDAKELEGDVEVCNIAYVAANGNLVESVINRVPQEGLLKLGVTEKEMEIEDKEKLNAIKLDKLNGRLLYRGWILVWVQDVPSNISNQEHSLVKLSPGRFFHPEVTHAMYVDQAFSSVLTSDDVRFLTSLMRQEPKETRIYKHKAKPKSKIRLGPEAARRAVVMLPQLKRQANRSMKKLPDNLEITTDQAVEFMMYEKGIKFTEDVPVEIQAQQSLYKQFEQYMSSDVNIANYDTPVYSAAFKHWARTRWVLHDLHLDEAQQFRCQWYKEHSTWNSKLDQLSLSKVMLMNELRRKVAFNEPPDDFSEEKAKLDEMTRGIIDHNDWQLLNSDKNVLVPSEYKAEVFAYDTPDTKLFSSAPRLAHGLEKAEDDPLYSRIVSETTLSAARKAWKKAQQSEEEE